VTIKRKDSGEIYNLTGQGSYPEDKYETLSGWEFTSLYPLNECPLITKKSQEQPPASQEKTTTPSIIEATQKTSWIFIALIVVVLIFLIKK
jgi:hypothetical protein